jgi:NAD(P)-dependent dehydrogenase (short-subunit alcohol dehydrogenase family)
MQIAGSVALVTGANRGIGRHFAEQLLQRGAQVYATARNPDSVDLPGAKVLPLDITDPESVAAAAAAAPDVSLRVNNAGISTFSNLITGPEADVRRELETHFFGTLSVIKAFAPALAAAGGGAILNMLSVLSWWTFEGATSYAAAKAAAWSLTNSVRLELHRQGTQVVGLHVGAVETDMMAGWDVPKLDPAEVARAGLDGIEAGHWEVLVGPAARDVKAALAADPTALYPEAQ